MYMDLSQAVSTADVQPTVAAPIFSYLEYLAITIGIRDGQIVRTRSRFASFVVFFANSQSMRLADRRLEALRAYAELAFALFPRSLPTTSLENAGFDGSQRRIVLAMIDAEHGIENLQK